MLTHTDTHTHLYFADRYHWTWRGWCSGPVQGSKGECVPTAGSTVLVLLHLKPVFLQASLLLCSFSGWLKFTSVFSQVQINYCKEHQKRFCPVQGHSSALEGRAFSPCSENGATSHWRDRCLGFILRNFMSWCFKVEYLRYRQDFRTRSKVDLWSLHIWNYRNGGDLSYFALKSTCSFFSCFSCLCLPPNWRRLTLHLCLSLVVYEHRSRLEKSLQKERLEHKKAKEGEDNCTAVSGAPAELASEQVSFFLDYLSYKLEAQQSINKEKVFVHLHDGSEWLFIL